MKCYKVNLDYESYLFDTKYKEDSHKSISMIREFEYVFFLVNKEKCNLKNYLAYEEKYLANLAKMGFIIPDFVPQEKEVINWWGEAKNKILEEKLNSKLTSAKLAIDMSWGMFDGVIVENDKEALNWIAKFPKRDWLLKNPYGVSGTGNFNFKNQIFTTPHLLEPIHERVCDIGTTFEIENGVLKRMFMVENSNSKSGSFKGGIAAESVDIFKNYILGKYSYDLFELEEVTLKILDYYLDLGATCNIQIDSFIYKEKDELKLYPLVEVNYRKTMGLVMQNLVDHFDAKLLEWTITHTNNFKDNSNWTKLSPEGNRFNTYFHIIS